MNGLMYLALELLLLYKPQIDPHLYNSIHTLSVYADTTASSDDCVTVSEDGGGFDPIKVPDKSRTFLLILQSINVSKH